MKHVEDLRSDHASATVSRREFTAASISALFVGMGVTLTGCGGGGGGSDYGTTPSPANPGASATTSAGDKSGQISGNHGHLAIVTAAQLQAGGAVALQIQGTADHSHGLQLSADQVRQVAGGTRVSQNTDAAQTAAEYGVYGEHNHTVIFN